MAAVSGGDLAIRTLAKAGVTHAFGIHGGHLETIFQACLTHEIHVTDARHEAAGGHAAEGYARSTGTLGVALATAGPGMTNVITSIANAFHDRIPVLYLTGSAALAHAEANLSQGGIDNVALARPITKWAHQITRPEDIPRLVSHAIRVATSAPTGPALLEIPMDVAFAMVDEDAVAVPDSAVSDVMPAPRPSEIEAALALLASAERPVIMLGEGAGRPGVDAELIAFAETTGIPVFAHYQSHGLFPSDHRLYGGSLFKMAHLSDPENRPDVVLALEARFGAYTLSPSELIVPANAKVIHVETDPAEIGKVRGVDVPIVAGSLETLRALNNHVNTWDSADFEPWQKTVAEARAAHAAKMNALLETSSARIHPYAAVSAIVDAIPENTIIVGDGAEAHQWLTEAARQTRPGSFFTHGQLSCLGFGMGFAVGVQVAHPDRPVLLVTGDGGAGFGIAEFDTMARHRLPIVVAVMNNRMWGATRHLQEIFSPGRFTGTELADTRYDTVAEGFGCKGFNVRELAELGPAVEAALAGGGPACINVAIEFAAMPPDSELLMSTF
jgi:acetolactate synthase I/II/III large subunit